MSVYSYGNLLLGEIPKSYISPATIDFREGYNPTPTPPHHSKSESPRASAESARRCRPFPADSSKNEHKCWHIIYSPFPGIGPGPSPEGPSGRASGLAQAMLFVRPHFPRRSTTPLQGPHIWASRSPDMGAQRPLPKQGRGTCELS